MPDKERNAPFLYELLALRLEVYGLPALDERSLCKALGRSTLWLETKNLLRGHGLSETEACLVLGIRHPPGCACWKCVLDLNRAARNRKRRKPNERRPADP